MSFTLIKRITTEAVLSGCFR